MTLQEAYAITAKMNIDNHRHPSTEQQMAKAIIYKAVIVPKFGSDDVPPFAEPDFMEGWH